MEINKINSLVELFFEKSNEKKLSTKVPFLKWLKDTDNNFLTWKKAEHDIHILSNFLNALQTI